MAAGETGAAIARQIVKLKFVRSAQRAIWADRSYIDIARCRDICCPMHGGDFASGDDLRPLDDYGIERVAVCRCAKVQIAAPLLVATWVGRQGVCLVKSRDEVAIVRRRRQITQGNIVLGE